MVGRDYRLTRDMRDAAGTLGLKLTETPITLRQAYADAPGQATFVWNMGYAAKGAREEIDHLFQELFPEITAKCSSDNDRITNSGPVFSTCGTHTDHSTTASRNRRSLEASFTGTATGQC